MLLVFPGDESHSVWTGLSGSALRRLLGFLISAWDPGASSGWIRSSRVNVEIGSERFTEAHPSTSHIDIYIYMYLYISIFIYTFYYTDTYTKWSDPPPRQATKAVRHQVTSRPAPGVSDRFSTLPRGATWDHIVVASLAWRLTLDSYLFQRCKGLGGMI